MNRMVALSPAFALTLAASASAASFSVSGSGGAIPDCPFSPGTWDAVPTWSTFTSSVYVSDPVVSLTKVRLSGLNHTFRGDIHVFLTDPSGTRYNIVVRPGFSGANAGDSGDYLSGTYDIVESGGSSLSQGTTNISGGTYDQFLNTGGGQWTSGTYAISNTPLSSITGPAGNWTLNIVDWFNVDTGSLTGWTLEGLVAGPGVTFCEPGLGGVIGCACGNPPSGPGRGCDNSSASGGAGLTATGVASLSADTLVFMSSGENPNALTILFGGTVDLGAGVPFNDGVLCTGGTIKRLYTHPSLSGSITAPTGSDPTVSARSSAVGSPISAGETRFYQVTYRDPAPFACPVPGGSTFNISSGRAIQWLP